MLVLLVAVVEFYPWNAAPEHLTAPEVVATIYRHFVLVVRIFKLLLDLIHVVIIKLFVKDLRTILHRGSI